MSRTIELLAGLAYLCAFTTGSASISTDEAELAAAIERWERLNADAYSYDFQRLCNCSPEAVATVHIESADEKIQSLTFVDDVYLRFIKDGRHGRTLLHRQGSKVPEEFTEEFNDIVFMMHEMEAILADQTPYEYDAVFDTEIGIPCRVYVDMSGGAIDEEVEFVVSNFSFTPERPTIEIGCAASENKFVHFPQPDF